MHTETMDKLYLEYSCVTSASTKVEQDLRATVSELEGYIERMEDTVSELEGGEYSLRVAEPSGPVRELSTGPYKPVMSEALGELGRLRACGETLEPVAPSRPGTTSQWEGGKFTMWIEWRHRSPQVAL